MLNKTSDVIMFADGTRILITANSQNELLQKFNLVLNHMLKWFQASQHTLNLYKTKVLKFSPAKLPNALNLTYRDC
jgi:hypothetical protein